MSLLLIARKLWRHKLATLPVLVVVLIGAFYVIAIKPPVYEANSSYILVNPPAPPTPDEIARDPKLGVGTSNPYTRYADQSIVVQIVAARLNSDDARRKLAAEGADPKYTVAPDVAFGYTAPIMQITGTGASPAAALKTTELVAKALTSELAGMQEAHGVSPKYRIDAQQFVAARDARLKASGKLRALVGLLALGGVALFLVVSIVDAFAAFRWMRARSDLDPEKGWGADGIHPAGWDPRSPVGPRAAEAHALSRRAWDESQPGRDVHWPLDNSGDGFDDDVVALFAVEVEHGEVAEAPAGDRHPSAGRLNRGDEQAH
jgi:hypothetical protein